MKSIPTTDKKFSSTPKVNSSSFNRFGFKINKSGGQDSLKK